MMEGTLIEMFYFFIKMHISAAFIIRALAFLAAGATFSLTYLNCWMGDHVKAGGWDNWRNPANELTARFSEYKSTGPGANPGACVKWSRQLTDAEAGNLTVENILHGSDEWKPTIGKLN